MNLQHKIASRYERMQRAVVVSRWLLARRMLAPGLKSVMPDLQAGEFKSVLKALDDFWMIFEISESDAGGDWGGTRYSIGASWYYGLGPRIKSRIDQIVRSTLQIRKALTFGGVTPWLVRTFQALIQDVAWLEGQIPTDEQGFPHGDFTVIPVKGVSNRTLKTCLQALDRAVEHIRPHFPQVLYGKVYFGTSVGRGYSNVAIYIPALDTISISTRASNTVGDVHAICHELGHRYERRFFKDKGLWREFRRLSTEPTYQDIEFDAPTRKKLADELVYLLEQTRSGAKASSGSDLLGHWLKEVTQRPGGHQVGQMSKQFTWDQDDTVKEKLWSAVALPTEPTVRIQTDQVIKPPLAVTPYGQKSSSENFAEAFALYVMGKPLPDEIAVIMRQIT